MKRGLVIGKFYPPHKGHSFLIDTALVHSDVVDVLVCDDPAQVIPAWQRADWLKQLHPTAQVKVIRDIGKDDDSLAWAEHTKLFLGYAPDTVYSSEDYGHAFAHFLGAMHHMVDKERLTVPISARYIRADVLKHWEYLDPKVRGAFCRRVCVLGAESTGTTTLTKALTEKYKAFWVQEFGRIYSEGKILAGSISWSSDEFEYIARQQNEQEDYLAAQSNGLLFCDTNAFATRLWHEAYMGNILPTLDTIAAQNPIDLYILTGDEIPHEQDGTRDGEHFRHHMHQRFIQELEASHTPYIIVTGSHEQRMTKATKHINTLLNETITIGQGKNHEQQRTTQLVAV